MAEEAPIPDSVEACRQELANLGLELVATDEAEAAFGFELFATDSKLTDPIERFGHVLWTELESAQAAVRFARYFTRPSDEINGKTATKPLSLEDTR